MAYLLVFWLWLFLFWDIFKDIISKNFWVQYAKYIEIIINNFDLIKLITAFLIFLISYKISFSVLNVVFKSRIAKELYDENIAEQKLTDNLEDYNNYQNTWLFRLWLFFSRNWYIQLIEAINNTALGIIILYIFSFFISFLFLFSILFFLIFLLSLPYGIGNYIFYFICLVLLWFLIAWLLKKFFSKTKYKFIIVIDELDKLLDFDKNIYWTEKWKIDMSSIFDILWKLKILFFDTKWLLFFVVTNKEAYDYHLKNKHQEDDLVSNIFNRILYLPMNEKEKFNLNFSVLWDDEKTRLSFNELSDFNKWLYFKSHWNWRKMRFILNEKLETNEKWENILNLNLDKINSENEFYKFFEKLYYLFNKESLENIEKWKSLYDFLIWENVDDKRGILIEFIENSFYKNYINSIGNILKNIAKEKKDCNKNIDLLISNLKENLKDPKDNLFKNIWFFISHRKSI